MNTAYLSKAQPPRTDPGFHVDNRRNTGSTLPLWVGCAVAGVIEHSLMGAAHYGKGFNSIHIGDDNLENQAAAYALANAVSEATKENA